MVERLGRALLKYGRHCFARTAPCGCRENDNGMVINQKLAEFTVPVKDESVLVI
jgi:hypothetical protein